MSWMEPWIDREDDMMIEVDEDGFHRYFPCNVRERREILGSLLHIEADALDRLTFDRFRCRHQTMSMAVVWPGDQASASPEIDQAIIGKVKEFLNTQKLAIIPSVLSGPPSWVCYHDPLAIVIDLSLVDIVVRAIIDEGESSALYKRRILFLAVVISQQYCQIMRHTINGAAQEIPPKPAGIVGNHPGTALAIDSFMIGEGSFSFERMLFTGEMNLKIDINSSKSYSTGMTIESSSKTENGVVINRHAFVPDELIETIVLGRKDWHKLIPWSEPPSGQWIAGLPDWKVPRSPETLELIFLDGMWTPRRRGCGRGGPFYI